MLARVYSSSLIGLEAYPVEVEVDVVPKGLPKITIVGLPDEAVKEARDRVKSAIKNSGYEFPQGRITVNLAPASIKKVGPDFDLALAIGIIMASGQMKRFPLPDYLVLGELALDGRIRAVSGVLPRVMDANNRGVVAAVVPRNNAAEASIVTGISVYPMSSLAKAVRFLQGEIQIDPEKTTLDELLTQESNYQLDMADVKGQQTVKRAIEIAVAGSHNILMIGPPGSGKTMLAKRIPSIIAAMTLEEALETTMVHSVAGMIKKGQTLVRQRPFRSPHHTISNVGLVGGSANPRPGEISLAHNGVLFLDELPEFHRDVLEVLRQPMEEGVVTVSRAKATHTFPARFMLVAAMNPCPCGYFTHHRRECRCTPGQRQKYVAKISGPLLDRIDIQIEVPSVEYKDMKNKQMIESSNQVKNRIAAVKEKQLARFQERKIYSNSQMDSKHLSQYCKLDDKSEELLKLAINDLGFSVRAHDKILKIARTIADLAGKEEIESGHLAEAIQYRVLDRDFAF